VLGREKGEAKVRDGKSERRRERETRGEREKAVG